MKELVWLTAPSEYGNPRQKSTSLATWFGPHMSKYSCQFFYPRLLEASLQGLRKHQMYEQVRALFDDIHKKQLDWPELIWELWISFEHLHGTVDQVDECLDKVEKAQAQVNARRAKVSLSGYKIRCPS